MVTRLTIATALIAFFGIALGFASQNTASRPGSAFASVSGGDCNYVTGIVCPLQRETTPASIDTATKF